MQIIVSNAPAKVVGRHTDYSKRAVNATLLGAGRNSGTPQKAIGKVPISVPHGGVPEPLVSRTHGMVLSYPSGTGACLPQSGASAWV